MERKSIWTTLALMMLITIVGAGAASAHVTVAEIFATGGTKATALTQADSRDVGPLPIQLTEQRSRALQSLRPGPSVQGVRVRRPRGSWFYRSALNHPLTPRDVALRDAVYRLQQREQEHPHQFVHVRLKDGKTLTGVITRAGASKFVVKTGILQGYQAAEYRDLAQEPREVPAVGTHIVHGLEWTGVVVGCIAVIPLAVIFYPLVAAGVIQD